MKFHNKCFIFKGNHKHQTEIKANWKAARDWCRKEHTGGDLAIIDDQSENGASELSLSAINLLTRFYTCMQQFIGDI